MLTCRQVGRRGCIVRAVRWLPFDCNGAFISSIVSDWPLRCGRPSCPTTRSAPFDHGAGVVLSQLSQRCLRGYRVTVEQAGGHRPHGQIPGRKGVIANQRGQHLDVGLCRGISCGLAANVAGINSWLRICAGPPASCACWLSCDLRRSYTIRSARRACPSQTLIVSARM
jgi:hypothetical protein